MRSRSPVGLVLAVVVVLLSASVVLADAPGSGRPLDTVLTGAEERPGPGDPDGSGTASIRLNQGQGTVCYELTWTGIETPHAAHIHRAPRGEPGPVVVGLFGSPTSSPATGCVQGVAPALIKEIRQDPAAFYVNVHNTPFPNGALRGQLGK